MRVLLLIAAICGPLLAADRTAVLPFSNRTPEALPGSSSLDWIGESIAVTLTEALGARGVAVIEAAEVGAAAAALDLKPGAPWTEGSALHLMHSLPAAAAVHGEFVSRPDQPDAPGSLRISARLTFPAEPRQVVFMDETGALQDLGALEAHLAWQVLRELAPQLAPPESGFYSLRAPARLDAQELYIRALLAPSEYQRESLLRRAARRDPDFWRPAFELGKLYLARKHFREAADWLVRVDPSDMHYREARFYAGLARIESGDDEGAQLVLAPLAESLPAGAVFNNLGAAESRLNSPHALVSFQQAVDADPSDPDYRFNLGYALWRTGQFEAAAIQLAAALEAGPDDAFAALLHQRAIDRKGPANEAGDAGEARLRFLERIKTHFPGREQPPENPALAAR